jgi:hypothetical protein
MSHRRIAVAASIAVVLAMGILFAQGKSTTWPVTIDIPGFTGNVVSLQTAGAWPLTVRMAANDPLGIATYRVPNPYPINEQQAFIVYSNPDECLSLSLDHDAELTNPTEGVCTGGSDEIYLEFTPTINLPNLLKRPIDNVRARRLGGRVTALGWESDGGNSMVVTVGPYDVGDVPNDESECAKTPLDPIGVGCDNYGYGASPNIPGLVILSDTGVGLVRDTEGFSLTTPRVARNLAGFVNSASWTANDCDGGVKSTDCDAGRMSVTAHMNVPAALFSPITRLDWNYPNTTTSQYDNVAYQIEGGELVEGSNFAALRSSLNAKVITVRVFVVSGRGPDQLEDMNRDGVVTSKDAALAGYKLLSGGDKIIRFRTLHQEHDSALGIRYDFNGNGLGPIVAPTGGGTITERPR